MLEDNEPITDIQAEFPLQHARQGGRVQLTFADIFPIFAKITRIEEGYIDGEGNEKTAYGWRKQQVSFGGSLIDSDDSIEGLKETDEPPQWPAFGFADIVFKVDDYAILLPSRFDKEADPETNHGLEWVAFPVSAKTLEREVAAVKVTSVTPDADGYYPALVMVRSGLPEDWSNADPCYFTPIPIKGNPWVPNEGDIYPSLRSVTKHADPAVPESPELDVYAARDCCSSGHITYDANGCPYPAYDFDLMVTFAITGSGGDCLILSSGGFGGGEAPGYINGGTYPLPHLNGPGSGDGNWWDDFNPSTLDGYMQLTCGVGPPGTGWSFYIVGAGITPPSILFRFTRIDTDDPENPEWYGDNNVGFSPPSCLIKFYIRRAVPAPALTGVLTTPQGGTGQTTLTSGELVMGNGTGAVQTVGRLKGGTF